jgi:uncharacterized protein YjbJ (UPF0337 family)
LETILFNVDRLMKAEGGCAPRSSNINQSLSIGCRIPLSDHPITAIICIQPSEVFMRNLSWIVASIGAGVALWILWNRQNRQYQAVGGDAIDDAAGETFSWGTRQRIAGSAQRVKGRVKEGLGRIAGNRDMAGEGLVTQAAGTARDAAGALAQAAGETIHDLNR